MKQLVHLLAGIMGVAAIAAPSPAAAQRSQSIEFGGFATYSRWDHLYFLKNSFGGGARIAYAWSDRLSIEVSGDYSKTVDTAAAQNVSVSTVSANLVFTSHGRPHDDLRDGGFRGSSSVPTRLHLPTTCSMPASERAVRESAPALRVDARAWSPRVIAIRSTQPHEALGPARSRDLRELPFSSCRPNRAAASPGSTSGTGVPRAAR